MFRWRRKHRRGFTFFEIMFVVVIIAVISAVIIYNVQRAKDQSKWKQCSTNIAMIANAIQMYATNNNYAYPTDLSILATNGRYLQGVPQCPVSNVPYYYTGMADGSRFTLYCAGTSHAGAGVAVPNKPSYDFDNLKVVEQ